MNAEKYWNRNISRKEYLGILFSIYLVSFYPIIRANYNYKDDMGRIMEGYGEWTNFSRYVSEALSRFIHGSRYLADISPIPQLLAIAILAVSGLVVVEAVRGKREYYLRDVAALLPLGVVPYFLECMSYKYDAPYMALSILASVWPVRFRKKKGWQYGLAVFAGTLVMCMTYQAASGIFPMLVVLLVFLDWCRIEEREDKKELFLFVVKSAAAYVTAIVVFFLFLMKPVDGYVSNGLADLPGILHHYTQYCRLVQSDFKKLWLLFVAALTVWFIVTAVKKSREKKGSTLILAVITSIVMFFLSFGLYPFLEKPLSSPRTLYGVGAYIAFIGIGILANDAKNIIGDGLVCGMSWLFITFAALYGNALSVQQDYEAFRMEEVIEDLTDLEEFNTRGHKAVQINGTVGYAQAVENMSSGYGILKRLIPVMFKEEWVWGEYKFRHYYGLEDAMYDPEIRVDVDDSWNLLQENTYHAIMRKTGILL